MTIPKKLKPGDKIGLIAPGSPVPKERIKDALDTLVELGLIPVLGKNVYQIKGYLAGTDSERLEDLHDMFRNDEIKGIWCLRGGYGCTRLLPSIDYELIRMNPKVFIGYSDITALHLAFNKKCSLVTFHGPVAVSTPTPYTISSLKKMVFEGGSMVINHAIGNQDDHLDQRYIINHGVATGPLTGGNLSLLAALAGTDYAPAYSGKLVFLEDIGEKPYRIDRMLVQLLQATDLAEASGVLLGKFYDCEADEDDRSLTLEETLRGQFEKLKIPVYYGFSFGHIDDQCTLPLGIPASFDTKTEALSIHETAVK